MIVNLYTLLYEQNNPPADKNSQKRFICFLFLFIIHTNFIKLLFASLLSSATLNMWWSSFKIYLHDMKKSHLQYVCGIKTK